MARRWPPWLLLPLLLLVTTMVLGPCHAYSHHTCMPGMSTPGITTPIGDIILEEGDTLDINCTLYPDHKEAQGLSADDIVFYQDNIEVPRNLTRILNGTTVQLLVPNLPMADYIYYCKLRQPQEKHPILCLNKVIVGSKPEEVQDFSCISDNWESLTCKWRVKENPIKTTYRIFFNLPGRAGRSYNLTCPKDTDERLNECKWDQSTTPIYRQPYEYYYFALTGINKLGTVTFPAIKFHHYAHVIPSPPVNVQTHNVTSNSVDLTWGVPQPLPNFPPGLHHRVEYRCKWDPKDHWEVANTSALDPHKNLTFHLTGLKYAYTRYEIRIRMKSSTAFGDEKWSKPEIVYITTSSAIPGASPKTDIGSFEIIGEKRRDVYIYWQQIPEYLQNGPNFEYTIIQQEENGEDKILTPNETTMSYAKIKGISSNSYKFTIYASNTIGRSVNPSVITIPSSTTNLPEPLSFTKIAFGDGVYELSWRKPPAVKNIESYTIFWCDSERDRPYQCTGFLNWTHVPHDQHVQNITVPDNKIHQFAISANTANSSSGLLWATCTVIHNKGLGKMKNVWVNKVGSTFIEVGWKLECSDRIGLVRGYKIYYCPIVSPVNLTCRDELMHTNVSGDSLNIHGNITDLRPYTTYQLSISVISREEGAMSEWLHSTTLEAAPEPPYDVQISNITNTSMVVTWEPPRIMNGVFHYYEVYVNDRLVQKVEKQEMSQVVLKNLPSFTNHSVYVTACTFSCSEGSDRVTVETAVGNPGMVEKLWVRRTNVSQFVVSWPPPRVSGGQLGYYELSVQQTDETNKSHTQVFFTTPAREVMVPVMDCKTEDKRRIYTFKVRAVNLDQNNKTYTGDWSDPQVQDSCFDSALAQSSVIIWTVSVVLMAILGLLAWFYGSKCWMRCKEMKNVEVRLPPGLDPQRDKELQNVMQRPPDLGISRHQPLGGDTQDSQLLLNENQPDRERHGRNPSGDSSGCSSGHDSVSSSLTSNTQISTDSGAEVDQTNVLGLSEGVYESSQLHSSRDGNRWSSFAQMSRHNGSCGGASSTPNLSESGESHLGLPDPPHYQCLGSSPSTGHLPSRTGDRTSSSSSSSLSKHPASVDATPTHSLSYCRVVAAPEDTPLRSQVPSSTPSPYVTIAQVQGVATPATTSSGYVPHPPLRVSSNPTTSTITPSVAPMAPERTLQQSVAAVPSFNSSPCNGPSTPPQRNFGRSDESCKDRLTGQLEPILEKASEYCRAGGVSDVRWPPRTQNNNSVSANSNSLTPDTTNAVSKANSYVKLGLDGNNSKPITSVAPPIAVVATPAPGPNGYVTINGPPAWLASSKTSPRVTNSYVPHSLERCDVVTPPPCNGRGSNTSLPDTPPSPSPISELEFNYNTGPVNNTINSSISK